MFLNWSLNENIRLILCVISLHCKFCNVIKINYGEPDWWSLVSLETPVLKQQRGKHYLRYMLRVCPSIIENCLAPALACLTIKKKCESNKMS